MSLENFHRFRELVLSDETLQSQIRDIEDSDEFIEKTLELASDIGLEFDAQTLSEEMLRGKREWIERWI